MAKPGPARRPNLQVVREGNPGKRPAEELESGVQLKPQAPDEPRWLDWWPPVRVPTKTKLQDRWPVEMVEGKFTHIEDDGKRRALAEARQEWMIHNEISQHERARKENQRARDVAKAEWNRIVPVLDAQGLLSVVDAEVLTDYVRVVARLDQCERDISRNGMWTEGERGAVKNPCVTAANQLRGQLKFYLGELGLTPVARDQLKPGGPNDDGGSPFD